MTQYTKAPWIYDKSDNTIMTVTYNCAVAVVANPVGEGEQEANAHLISAAPDLLEALKELRDNVSDDSPAMWERVNAAIAKAEGK